MKNIGMLTELCRALNINYSVMIEEMLRFVWQTIADDQRLPADRMELDYFQLSNLNISKFQLMTLRKLTCSRSTAPTPLEQRPSATVVLLGIPTTRTITQNQRSLY